MSPFKPVQSRVNMAATTQKRANKNFFADNNEDLNDRVEFDRSIKIVQSSQNAAALPK